MSGRILMASWDGGGNALSALNLGARLVRQNHRVRLLGWESMALRAAAAGIEFAAYSSVPAWQPERTLESAWKERVIPALFGPGTRDDICAEAKKFAPDVVVVDCMMGAGLEAAGLLSIPYVILTHVSYHLFAHEWGSEASRVKKACYLDRAAEVLILMPPGFDAPCPLPDNATYVGPILDPSPAPPLSPSDARLLAEPGNPWVLLSLSTTRQRQAEVLPRIFEAVVDLPIRVLLTVGWGSAAAGLSPGQNVIVREFIPHDLLLPYMAAVISHAGLGTITSALAGGAPLVCIPQGRDQPYNAQRVEACGVGRIVTSVASPTEIATSIKGLLADQAPLDRVHQFANVIAELGRGDAAVRRVARLIC